MSTLPTYRPPPVGVFEDRAETDKPKLNRAAAELRNAKMLVRALRSKCALVLREIRKPLVVTVITRLRAIVENPETTALEIIYAGEVINRLLATTAELAAHFGVDDFAAAAEQAQRNRRAARLSQAAVNRAEQRAARHREQARELAEQAKTLLAQAQTRKRA